MKLFSDKALIQLFNMTHSNKPNNKEYLKLRNKLKGFPDSGKEPDGGTYNAKVVPYDIVEDFMNCPDFIDGGFSCRKIKPKNGVTERRLYRVSVLPAGNSRRTYYKFIVEGFDKRMVDETLTKQEAGE